LSRITAPEGRGTPISHENKALFDYGVNAVLDSINVIKDYLKLMIPLTTSLISAYFAILKLLGFESLNGELDNQGIIIPAVLLLMALTAFIITIFPLPLKITIGNILSIRRYRKNQILFKYVGSVLGSIFFISGVILMVMLMSSMLF
jgi:hypothetical protein